MAEPTAPPSDAPATDAPAAPAVSKTFSQDELDRIVGERLAKERQKFGDYDDLKTKASEFDKLTEAQKTEAQKAQERAAELEARAQHAESRLMRHEVATAKKLPADALDLLHGSTREELEAQADRILALTNPPTSFDGGTRQPAPTGGMDSLIRRAAGR